MKSTVKRDIFAGIIIFFYSIYALSSIVGFVWAFTNPLYLGIFILGPFFLNPIALISITFYRRKHTTRIRKRFFVLPFIFCNISTCLFIIFMFIVGYIISNIVFILIIVYICVIFDYFYLFDNESEKYLNKNIVEN